MTDVGASSQLRVLELCAGYGGFSLGLRLAEPRARTVCYVEREAFCIDILVRQMEAGGLDPAPVWTDLTTFDGRAWRGCVDLVTAGFPCQPWSSAGKRLGADDERYAGIWPHIARIVGECRPWGVFLENVALDAFRGPRADLEALGYRVPPAVCIGAEHVGAPHRRLRWWCLATDAERAGLEGPTWLRLHGSRREAKLVTSGGADVADTLREGQLQPGRLECAERRRSGDSGVPLPDANEPRLAFRQGERGDDGAERETAFGAGWWLTEPDVGRVAHGVPARVDRLRALGNGVVPQCVAAAWEVLTR